jgi:hypothetical protein
MCSGDFFSGGLSAAFAVALATTNAALHPSDTQIPLSS